MLHGFVRSADGTFTTFDAPGAGAGYYQGTYSENINDAGTISGDYQDWNYVYHGYVLNTDGTFTIFEAPGAGGITPYYGTVVSTTGMNSKGAITGWYNDEYGTHGYVRFPDGSKFPTVDVYGAIYTQGFSITTNETITGIFVDYSFVYHGYLRAPGGAISTLNDPLAGTAPEQGTFAYALNPSDTVAGQYVDGGNVVHGFVRSSHGVYTTIDVPGGTATSPQAINLAGAITGYFYDQNGAVHGFLYTP